MDTSRCNYATSAEVVLHTRHTKILYLFSLAGDQSEIFYQRTISVVSLFFFFVTKTKWCKTTVIVVW